MNVETPEGSVIEIQLGKRDVLVLLHDSTLSAETADRLKSLLLTALEADAKALVLGDGLRLAVLHRDDEE